MNNAALTDLTIGTTLRIGTRKYTIDSVCNEQESKQLAKSYGLTGARSAEYDLWIKKTGDVILFAFSTAKQTRLSASSITVTP